MAALEVPGGQDHGVQESFFFRRDRLEFRAEAAGLGGVGYQVIDFGGPKIAGVDIEMLFRVEFSAGESAGSRKLSLTEFRST